MQSDFNEYKQLILKDLKDNADDHKIIIDEIKKLSDALSKFMLDSSVEMREIKVKSGIISVLAGSLPVVITLLYLLTKGIL